MNALNLELHRPEVITKNLAFNCVGGKKKVRLSTNFIQVMGFNTGERIQAAPLGSLNGFRVVKDEKGAQQVYNRTYNGRRANNPFECVLEFGGQALINDSFPAYTERFHVEMRSGEIIFSPMANRVHAIHSKFTKANPFTAFVGLTGGVDVHCLESLGWKTEIVLEWRPQEARDVAANRNLSEVYALNNLVNGSPRVLMNENIYSVDLNRLERILSDSPPITLCHFSLGCDDHSTAKSKTAKTKSLDDLTTMYDMVYPALKQIELIGPAIAVVENVKQFASSGAGMILSTTLRRLGYHVTEIVRNALDSGSTQGRERYYMVASIYPGFEAPALQPRSITPLGDLILKHLDQCNDVTDASSIKKRSTKGRNMPPYLTVDSTYCPTILKSQDRGVSDAIYIQHQDRIYKPSIEMIQELMSIPESFNTSWMAKEQATETLGQSIDYKLHHDIMTAVTRHIELNTGSRTIVRMTKEDRWK